MTVLGPSQLVFYANSQVMMTHELKAEVDISRPEADIEYHVLLNYQID